jgi:hypothetical protein
MHRRVEGPQNGEGGVQHAPDTPGATTLHFPPAAASCAACGGSLPAGRRGGPRPKTRYCSAACRCADVRERRAAARSDLLVALGQLAEVTRRVESALRVLGLNPRRPRTRPKEHM